jgi:hypothetical protein
MYFSLRMEEVGSRKSVNLIDSNNSTSSIQAHFISLFSLGAPLTNLACVTSKRPRSRPAATSICVFFADEPPFSWLAAALLQQIDALALLLFLSFKSPQNRKFSPTLRTSPIASNFLSHLPSFPDFIRAGLNVSFSLSNVARVASYLHRVNC